MSLGVNGGPWSVNKNWSNDDTKAVHRPVSCWDAVGSIHGNMGDDRRKSVMPIRVLVEREKESEREGKKWNDMGGGKKKGVKGGPG